MHSVSGQGTDGVAEADDEPIQRAATLASVNPPLIPISTHRAYGSFPPRSAKPSISRAFVAYGLEKMRVCSIYSSTWRWDGLGARTLCQTLKGLSGGSDCFIVVPFNCLPLKARLGGPFGVQG